MARTEAYGDYCERLRESLELLRVASGARDQRLASGSSKGAVVLAAAALERYMNDAVLHVCRTLSVDKWEELPSGTQSYLIQQFARRLEKMTTPVLESSPVAEKKAARLRKVVEACTNGFARPANWDHHPQFGLFKSGDTAPERIGGALNRFAAGERELFDLLDERKAGREAFMRALSELVEARHAAAHALPDRANPGPKDAQSWIVSSFWLVRVIEQFVVMEIGMPGKP